MGANRWEKPSCHSVKFLHFRELQLGGMMMIGCYLWEARLRGGALNLLLKNLGSQHFAMKLVAAR